MRLKKELTFFDVFSIAAGSMISSGLFVLPGIAYAKAGPAAVLAYFFAGILMLPSIFVQSELSTAMPKAGGTYFYINRILGTPVGFIAGFSNWFSIAFKSAFALIGMGAFALLINPHFSELHIKLIASFFTIFFMVLNLFSTKHSGRFQSLLVSLLLFILFLFIIRGYPSTHMEHFHFFLRKGWINIFTTTGMVFISFGGLTKIASMAEEIHDPGKNLPRAMFWAFFVVISLYVIIVAVIIGTLPHTSLITTLTPVSSAAGVFAGKAGIVITALSALMAFITTANAGIMSAARSPLAMSRDSLLPGFFGSLSRKYGTPYVGIISTGAFILIIINALHIEELVKVASAFMLLLFLLINVSLIVIRYSNLRNYRPTYKAPLFPYINIPAIIIYGILIVKMGTKTLFIMSLFILFSVVWYFIFIRKRQSTQSAFLSLVTKAINKQLVHEPAAELEEELLTILKDRDNIIEDRFDRLIKGSLILDLKDAMTRDDFFLLLSDHVSSRLGLSRDDIYKAFIQREESSSTNIVDGIAIPHVILPDKDKFELVLVRSQNGILWTPGAPPVHAVFAILGTEDERNYHLRALMAIAQLVQNKSFLSGWLHAKDSEDIRCSLLLMPRKRDD